MTTPGQTAPKNSPNDGGNPDPKATPDPKDKGTQDPSGGGSADDNKGGTPDPKAGDFKWREPIVALAGDNAERKALLEGFESFDDMAAALERGRSDDWRELMSGGDSALKKELERYTSPAEAGRALKEAKDRIRSGGASVPAADASPEDWAKFSTENLGRPEKPEDIKVEPKLPDGEELTTDEATIVSAVLGAAHKSGKFGEAHFQDLAQVVVDLLVGGRKEMETRAGAKKTDHEKALRKVWTNDADFKANVGYANAASAALCQQAGVDSVALGDLVLADGTRLGDHEAFARTMAVAGRLLGEDPNLGDDNGGGTSLADLQAQLKAETDKRKGTAKEKAEYDTPEAAKRRADLRGKIDRAKARGRG